MNKWLTYGIGAALLYYGVLRGAKGLVVRVKDFAFKGLNLANKTVSLYLNVLVKNPLFVGITINSIVGDVYAQGKKIGAVNTTLNYYISGGKTHVLPVVVDLNMGDMGDAALLNIQSGDIRNLTIDFNGKIYAGKANVGVPLQLTLNYEDWVK